MNRSDREKIQKNLIHLSKHINLTKLSDELVRREIIDRDDVMRIKGKFATQPEQNQEFFLFYTKRGPDAYTILIEALKATGHMSEAILLAESQDPDAEQSPVSPISQNSFSETNGTGNDDIMVSSITSLTLPSPTTGAAVVKMGLSGVVPIDDSSISSFVFERPTLKIEVKKATIYNQGKTNRVYQMMSKPRGFCLIINNINFPGDPKSTRTGAENDTENLRQLFEAFGFIVTARHNVTKNELIDPENGIIKNFLDQFRQTRVDTSFVALMSHGSKSLLRTCDPMVPENVRANHVDIYEDILYRFNNRNCPVLMGKPKLFLVQACRGKHHDRGVRRTQVDGKKLAEQFLEDMAEWESEYLPERYPEMEDFLVCNSTVHGYVSNRDTDRGSWYVECFCQVLMEMAHNTEILNMLKEVAILMRNIQSELGEKQMCNFDNTGFFNDFYFNPGLYANPDGVDDAVPGSSTS